MLTMTEAGDHGNCVISPEGDDEVQFFLMIGAGQHEKQNELGEKICRAVNSHEALIAAVKAAMDYIGDRSAGSSEFWDLAEDALSLATGGRNE